jgi:hypothetical protein
MYSSSDDDFVFDEHTRIERPREILEEAAVDLVAGNIIEDGNVVTYDGLLRVHDGCLEAYPGEHSTIKGARLVDLTVNFFLARTELLLNVLWDEHLKVGEHLDFFLRAKNIMRCAHTAEVTVGHQPVRNDHYNKFRNRAVQYMLNFMDKHDLTRIDARPIGGDLWTPQGVVTAVAEIEAGERDAFRDGRQ